LEEWVIKSALLSRRAFVRTMGFAPFAVRTGWVRAVTSASRVAYAGTVCKPQAGLTKQDEIRVYGLCAERWRLKQVVASAAPVSLTVHPNRRFLYAVNEVDRHEGLPTGTVEAYAIDAAGKLTFLNRKALALSATSPRHLAISPDGKSAMVAVHGGGAYNLLSIGQDGRLGRVAGIVKETGCGPCAEHQDSAHPQMSVFDRTGRHVLAVDMGTDRLSVLSIEGGKLEVRERHALDAGSGPRQIAQHPAGRWIYVANGLDGSVCGYEYDPMGRLVLGRVAHIEAGAGATMALHPSGEFLYTAADGTGIRGWKVDAATGRLTEAHKRPESFGGVCAMTFEFKGAGLIVLSDAMEGVVRLPIASGSGRLGQPELVASAPGLRSIVIA
jgi:6-phosphogluconolactonase